MQTDSGFAQLSADHSLLVATSSEGELNQQRTNNHEMAAGKLLQRTFAPGVEGVCSQEAEFLQFGQ